MQICDARFGKALPKNWNCYCSEKRQVCRSIFWTDCLACVQRNMLFKMTHVMSWWEKKLVDGTRAMETYRGSRSLLHWRPFVQSLRPHLASEGDSSRRRRPASSPDSSWRQQAQAERRRPTVPRLVEFRAGFCGSLLEYKSNLAAPPLSRLCRLSRAAERFANWLMTKKKNPESLAQDEDDGGDFSVRWHKWNLKNV